MNLETQTLILLDDKYNLQAFKAEITVRYAIPINVVTFSMLVVCVFYSVLNSIELTIFQKF